MAACSARAGRLTYVCSPSLETLPLVYKACFAYASSHMLPTADAWLPAVTPCPSCSNPQRLLQEFLVEVQSSANVDYGSLAEVLVEQVSRQADPLVSHTAVHPGCPHRA